MLALELDPRVTAGEVVEERPVGGGRAAVEEAGLGEEIGAGALGADQGPLGGEVPEGGERRR